MSRPLGAMLIVAGTAIGGGMLALPIVSAQLGFAPMMIIMIAIWFIMCVSALLTLDVNLLVKPGCSFLTMSDETLGRIGNIISTLSFLFLFYALLAAYITGSASFMEGYFSQYSMLHWSHVLYCIVATVIVTAILLLGVKVVDRINRIFFIFMVAAFITILVFLILPGKVSIALLESRYNPEFSLSVLPVVFTAFGFHGCTTPLVAYVGNNRRLLRLVFIAGSLIPLIAYILWLIVSLGVLDSSQAEILSSRGSVGLLTRMLSTASGDFAWFRPVVNLFSGFAIITSFLGVALGLFDYIHFGMKKSELFHGVNIFGIRPFSPKDNGNRKLRSFTGLILAGVVTFIPPLFFGIFFPDAFVKALGYAAIPLAFIATLLPLAMMRVLERRGHVFKGKWLYLACGVCAIIVIFAQLGTAWHLLPSVGG